MVSEKLLYECCEVLYLFHRLFSSYLVLKVNRMMIKVFLHTSLNLHTHINKSSNIAYQLQKTYNWQSSVSNSWHSNSTNIVNKEV